MLVENQGSRIASLHREYSEELERLKEEFSTEREKMMKSHQFECNDLQDIMFAMEQEFNEMKTEALHDFQSQKDEIKNKVRLICITYLLRLNNNNITILL